MLTHGPFLQDAVHIKLEKTFEKGQAYVALSRCRTPAGMRVEGFQPGHIMGEQRCDYQSYLLGTAADPCSVVQRTSRAWRTTTGSRKDCPS